MAWFRRKRDEAPAEDTADAVAPEPTPGAEPAAGTRPAGDTVAATPAWTTAAPLPSVIPTIQRSLGRIEARSATTLGKPAPLCLAPLGHAVTPDAPAGVIGTTAVTGHEGHDHGPAIHDQPPLDYVQRAPAGSVPGRPGAPAQLLVPSFQPSQMPRVPVAAPEVQRAPATSFTTAPDPSPPLVLPVGEVLSPPAAEPAPDAPPASAAGIKGAEDDAPLLAARVEQAAAPPAPPAPAVPRAPAVELPLAPVQRHADHPDHPGHVDGDEAAAEAEVQRAPLDAPAPPAAAPDAPLLADAPLRPAAPLAGPDEPAASEAGGAPAADLPLAPVQRHADQPDRSGHVDGDEAPDVQRTAAGAPAPTPPPVQSAPLVGDAAPLVGDAAPLAATPAPEAAAPAVPAPDLSLPSVPVQRSAGPRRPLGLGAPIPVVPSGAGQPDAVQRAPLSPPATPPAPTAPLVGQAPLPPAAVPPLGAVQRAAAEDGGAEEEAGTSSAPGAPALDLVQRAAEPGAPSPSAAAELVPAGEDAGPPATAPLVGETPLEPAIGASPAAPAPGAGDGTLAAPAPELELVQRAPLATSAASSATSAATKATSSSSAATHRAAPLPPLVVAPLLGGRPFATQVQRSAEGAASAPSGLVDRSGPEALSPEPGRVYQPLASIGMWNGAPPPDLPGPAVEAPPSHIAAAVQRATGTDVSNTRIRRDTGPAVQRLAARAFTHEGEVHIPASVGSLSTGEGASLVTHELVHAGQQSVLGASRPHEHTLEGQHLEAQARAAEHASVAGTELPTMPLAPPPAPAVQRAPAEGGNGSSPFSPEQLNTLMRLADNPPSSSTSLQREVVAPPRPSAAAPDLPDVPPARPDTPAPGGPTAQTPQELEELAHKLFPAMRNLFRGELLGFRRRFGTSSDHPLS